MAYIIYAFDGLEIPFYLSSGDEQDMGTGQALTSFAQLPGGGFFDNYGRRKSPQGIRPITKSGMVAADSAAEARAMLDTLRAKIGVRGKLTLLFDDGSMRWQWARLQSVSTPRKAADKNNWFAFDMTWISAAQHWYGIVYPADWTWGDGSWVFGDGTAEYGTSTHTTTAEDPVAISHNGNIDAVNVTISVTFTGGGNAGFSITNDAATAGNRLEYLDEDTPVAPSDVLVLDCSARSARLHKISTPYALTNIYGLGDYLDVTTATAHGLVVGDAFEIAGTENFDGIYTVAQALSTSWVRAALDVGMSGDSEAVGNLYPIIDQYAYLTLYDRSRWFVLAPGTNGIGVINNGDLDNDEMTFEFSFHDHYA